MKCEISSAPPTMSEPEAEAAERTATVHLWVWSAWGSACRSFSARTVAVFPYIIGRKILRPCIILRFYCDF
jgi:hypothetical protein